VIARERFGLQASQANLRWAALGKLKEVARIRLRSGEIRQAELHWYEAHGIGKKEIKRKKYLD
jgi:hypothetical protein